MTMGGFLRPPTLRPGSFASLALTELSLHGHSFFQLYGNSFGQRGLGRFICIIINFPYARLHVHPWLLDEVGNHSCGVRFRPGGSAPQALHLWPLTVGNLLTWLLSKMLLNGVLINVDVGGSEKFEKEKKIISIFQFLKLKKEFKKTIILTFYWARFWCRHCWWVGWFISVFIYYLVGL